MSVDTPARAGTSVETELATKAQRCSPPESGSAIINNRSLR